MPSQRNRRKSLVVNKAMQRKIITGMSLIPTLSLAATMILVGAYCRRLMNEAETADVALPSLIPLFVSVLIFVIVMGLVVMVRALRFSHRIAGPQYRLIRAFEQIHQGDISFRVKLRDGDFGTELADSFNQHLDWLEEKLPEQEAEVALEPSEEQEPEPVG